MAQVTITINSREYGIACGDGQEAHIIKLSRLLDEKAKLLTSGNGQINENMLLAMVGLLLADEIEDAKKGIATSINPEPKIVEKIVEIEKPVEVEKIVEIEKVVEKIVEVEKPHDLSIIDNELCSAINAITTSLSSIVEDIKSI